MRKIEISQMAIYGTSKSWNMFLQILTLNPKYFYTFCSFNLFRIYVFFLSRAITSLPSLILCLKITLNHLHSTAIFQMGSEYLHLFKNLTSKIPTKYILYHLQFTTSIQIRCYYMKWIFTFIQIVELYVTYYV